MTATDPAAPSARPSVFASALTHATSDLKGIATLLITIASFFGAFIALPKAIPLSSPWAELVSLVPIVLFVGLYIWPEWRAARQRRDLENFGVTGELPPPGYFRLTPYGADDRDKFRRPDGAERAVLNWILRSNDAILYLAGASGVGKSSLLGAHVIPELKEAGWVVVEARPSDNPLEAIRTALQKPSLVWKQPPKEKTDLRSLLERAANAVGKGEKRLLLVLDQFEEVLILLDHERRRPFDDLLQDLCERPINKLALLLSLRSDYTSDLEALPIPRPTLGRNWFEVKRFAPAAARHFLERSDLKPGAQLIDHILREAAEIEDSLDRVRPVIVNMYGLVLSSFKGRLPADLVSGRLLSGYVRRCLDRREIRDVSRAVVAPLVTDAGTKRARPLEDIADKAHISEARARGGLLHLAEDGLVRAVDKAGQRWEVAHDFVARLMLPLLESGHMTLWERARPWLAPGTIAAWTIILAVAALLYPDWQQARVRMQLTEAGFSEQTSPFPGVEGPVFRYDGKADQEKFARGISLLREVRPPVAGLILFDYGSAGEPSLVGLSGLRKLTVLQIGGPTSTLKELPSLPTLDNLFLSDAGGLTSLKDLPSFPALTLLFATGARDLTSLKDMPALPALKTLIIGGVRSLTALEGMPSLPALTSMSFLQASNLTSLKGMPSLPALRELGFSGATRLTSLRDMPSFPALAVLDLLGANSLTSLADMPALPKLTTLDFSGASGLTIDGPSEQQNLPDLKLFESRMPLDLASLSVSAPTLLRLDLGPTPIVNDNYADLAQLTKLRDLGLYGARIRDLSAVSQLNDLETIDLRNLADLDLNPIERVSSLKTVRLSSHAKDSLRIPPALNTHIKWDCNQLGSRLR
jgi:Novel STAND NTPase 1